MKILLLLPLLFCLNSYAITAAEARKISRKESARVAQEHKAEHAAKRLRTDELARQSRYWAVTVGIKLAHEKISEYAQKGVRYARFYTGVFLGQSQWTDVNGYIHTYDITGNEAEAAKKLRQILRKEGYKVSFFRGRNLYREYEYVNFYVEW